MNIIATAVATGAIPDVTFVAATFAAGYESAGTKAGNGYFELIVQDASGCICFFSEWSKIYKIVNFKLI